MAINSKSKLLLTSAVLALSLSGCGSGSFDDNIKSAQTLLAQGNENEAIIHLKNAIKIENRNAQSRFLLGKAYAMQGLWLQAEKELSRAYEYGFEQQQLLPVLAQVHFKLVDSAALEELLTNPTTPEVELVISSYLAMTYIEQGDLPLARKLFEQVIADNNSSPFVYLSKAYLAAMENNPQEALLAIDEIFTVSPDFFEAQLFQAQLLYNNGQISLAVEQFKAYLTQYKNDNKARMLYAEALVNDGQFDAAEKQVDFLLKISPNHILLNQIKAQARFADEDYKQAKEYAEVALRGYGNMPIARMVAGISAYKLQQLELAYNHLMAIESSLSYQHPARKLLTSIRFQLGYDQESFTELSAAPLAELDSDLLSFSAKELFKQGEFAQAEHLMLKAAQLDPENAQISYQRGVLKLLRGDNSATDIFEQILVTNPDSGPAVAMLVMQLVNEEKYTQAFQIASKFKEYDPELSSSLLGGIYNKKGELDKAKAAFLEVVDLNENHLAALYNLAKIAEQQQQYPQAISYYQQMFQVDNQHMPAILGLVVIAKNKDYQNNIKKIFSDNLAANPSDSIANFAMVEFYLAIDDVVKANQATIDGLALMPNDIKLLVSKANIEFYLKEYDESLATLDRVQTINPNAFGVYLSKSKVYLAKGKLTSAINQQKIAVKAKPDVLSFKLTLIKLYLKNGNTILAKTTLQSLSEQEQADIVVVELEGRTAYIEKNYKKAAIVLNRVYQEKPSEQVLFELVTALQQINLSDKALKLLKELEEPNKVLPLRLAFKQAELYSKNQPQKAIDIYLQLAKNTDNHYVVLNNLALLYLQQGSNTEALKAASVAIKSAPSEIAVQDTYGLALLATGDKKQALAFLAKVYQAEKESQNYKVHYAQALLANNSVNEAKELLVNIDNSKLDTQTQQKLKEIQKRL